MSRTRTQRLLLFCVLVLFYISYSRSNFIDAIPDYSDFLPESYGRGCIVCHESSSSGGPLNSFGSDFSDYHNSIESTFKLDSDGDGVSNEVELKAGTFPGDPESSPKGYGKWLTLGLVAVGITLVVGVIIVRFRAK